jgi:hypothetical protein
MSDLIREYAFGSTVYVELEVEDLDDQDVDPTAVTIRFKKPDGTVVGPFAPTKEAVGHYSYAVVGDQAGVWAWEWLGAGANAGASDGQFRIRKRRVP